MGFFSGSDVLRVRRPIHRGIVVAAPYGDYTQDQHEGRK